MFIQTWWLWMAAAAIFIIAEIFTAGFFIMWFGIGAAVAGIIALIGLGAGWQWATFVVVSGVLFGLSRRFAEKFSKKQPPGIGADRFLDQVGVVTETIDNLKNQGRVRLDREEWRADSESGELIKEGIMVKVVRLNGTHLIVNQLEEDK